MYLRDELGGDLSCVIEELGPGDIEALSTNSGSFRLLRCHAGYFEYCIFLDEHEQPCWLQFVDETLGQQPVPDYLLIKETNFDDVAFVKAIGRTKLKELAIGGIRLTRFRDGHLEYCYELDKYRQPFWGSYMEGQPWRIGHYPSWLILGPRHDLANIVRSGESM